MSNMAFEHVDIGGREVLITLHTVDAPTEDEWSRWIALCSARARDLDQDLGRSSNLVLTDGGAPNRDQRTALNVIISQARTLPLVAVVTDSMLVRSMVRALTVFNPRLQVFAPVDLTAALRHLRIPGGREAEVIDACALVEAAGLRPKECRSLGAICAIRRAQARA